MAEYVPAYPSYAVGDVVILSAGTERILGIVVEVEDTGDPTDGVCVLLSGTEHVARCRPEWLSRPDEFSELHRNSL